VKRIGLYSVIVLVVVIIGSVFAFAVFQPVKVLPRIRLSPGFSLVDQDGGKLTNEDMRGKIVLYNFAYSNCPEPCDELDQTMREVQDGLAKLNEDGVPVELVTISIDPERDTPEVLNGYANRVGASPDTWHFATTDNTSLLKTIIGAGFEVFYQAKEDGNFELTPAFVLVDGLGIIRGEYQYVTSPPDAERMLRHINVLQEEAANAVGAAKLVYEAAHLFLCYED
jgi:protein SCO1/2